MLAIDSVVHCFFDRFLEFVSSYLESSVNIATRLKSIREKNGLSVAMLAKMAKVSRATVTGIESGQKEPRGGSVHAIAQALGTTANYLLTGQGEEPLPVDAAHPLGLRENHWVSMLYKSYTASRPAVTDSRNPQDPRGVLGEVKAAWRRFSDICLNPEVQGDIMVELSLLARDGRTLGPRDVLRVFEMMIDGVESVERAFMQDLENEKDNKKSRISGESEK
jgi:transcriptional regulator with XRE-family HTH domain